jgi:hypothetical protein
VTLYAEVPVADLDGGIDWSTRFFGRGSSSCNTRGQRPDHVKIPDPEGNAIAFAGPSDAA